MKIAQSLLFTFVLTGCAPDASEMRMVPITNSEGPDVAAQTPTTEVSDTGITSEEVAHTTQRRLRALPDLFNCLREERGVALAAHRGGFGPGYPENTLKTLNNSLNLGAFIFEVDISKSRDGVLHLFHDRSMYRMSGRGGEVGKMDWREISSRALQDETGRRTSATVPDLASALEWAVNNDAILELDLKDGVDLRDVMHVVREVNAENNIILITYDDADVHAVVRHAPNAMLTAWAKGNRDLGRLEDMGVNAENLLAWTGTDRLDAAAWARLQRIGVEPVFGTLGRDGESFDWQFNQDGDLSEYQDLVDDGVVLIATDHVGAVASELRADDVGQEVCRWED